MTVGSLGSLDNDLTSLWEDNDLGGREFCIIWRIQIQKYKRNWGNNARANEFEFFERTSLISKTKNANSTKIKSNSKTSLCFPFYCSRDNIWTYTWFIRKISQKFSHFFIKIFTQFLDSFSTIFSKFFEISLKLSISLILNFHTNFCKFSQNLFSNFIKIYLKISS